MGPRMSSYVKPIFDALNRLFELPEDIKRRSRGDPIIRRVHWLLDIFHRWSATKAYLQKSIRGDELFEKLPDTENFYRTTGSKHFPIRTVRSRIPGNTIVAGLDDGKGRIH